MDLKSRLLQTFVRLAQDLKKSNPLLVLALGMIPLCLVVFRLEQKNMQIQAWTRKISDLEERAISSKTPNLLKIPSGSRLSKAIRSTFLKSVETLPLLTPELSRVQALAKQYPSNSALQERLSFLQGDKNRIRFTQQAERSGSFFQETEHKMQNSVQMNENDLIKFLTAIEADSKDRPLLIIKEFELKKLKEKADETVYNVQAELIKRAP